MSERGVALYISDILEAIEKIEHYTAGMSFDVFQKDPKTIDAVVRNIEVIGEAVIRLPADLKSKHPTIPWKLIAGARNKAIHEYFGIDVSILWQTVQEDVPMLKKEIAVLSKT